MGRHDILLAGLNIAQSAAATPNAAFGVFDPHNYKLGWVDDLIAEAIGEGVLTGPRDLASRTVLAVCVLSERVVVLNFWILSS